MPYVEAALGFALIGGAIWAGAALLRRFAGFDITSAILLSIVVVPLLMFAAFYVWLCASSVFCL